MNVRDDVISEEESENEVKLFCTALRETQKRNDLIAARKILSVARKIGGYDDEERIEINCDKDFFKILSSMSNSSSEFSDEELDIWLLQMLMTDTYKFDMNKSLTIKLDYYGYVQEISPQNKMYDILFQLCSLGRAKALAFVLENYGDQLNINYSGKDSLICLAVSRGHIDVVRVLLDFKQPVYLNIKSNGRSPIMAACENGYVDILKLLLTYPKDKGYMDLDMGAGTPLLLASNNGHISAVKVLLEYGLAVNNLDGLSALYSAFKNQRPNIAAHLMVAGANEMINDSVREQLSMLAQGHKALQEVLDLLEGNQYISQATLWRQSITANKQPSLGNNRSSIWHSDANGAKDEVHQNVPTWNQMPCAIL